MPLYQAVVLAVVQGLTEFLPVSSTAHLALFPWLFGWTDPGLTFDVALHAGTLVAVLLYFGRPWVGMLTAAVGFGKRDDPKVHQNRKLFWLLVIGTIPGGVAGILFERAAETKFRQPIVIGTALIVVALLMWAGDRLKNRRLTLDRVGLSESLVVGAAQALAVIPGVSRSGVTMTAGLFRGMTRKTAARFSFLLSTPLIAGAALMKGLEVRHEGLPLPMRLPFTVGVMVSGLVGYLIIAWLIRFLERGTFRVFVYYRVTVGVVVVAVELASRFSS